MRSILLAGAAAVSLIAFPAALSAQMTEPAPDSSPPASTGANDMSQADKPAMSAEQRTMYDSWDAQKRSDYDSWTVESQTYYWTLEPDQQTGYWAMTPDQRGMIYRMTPEQRAQAWNSVSAQMEGQTPTTPMGQANPPGTGMPTSGVPDPQMASQSAPPAMPSDPSYQGSAYKGALTPPPATAMNKTYPVCTRTRQDSCRNPGGV